MNNRCDDVFLLVCMCVSLCVENGTLGRGQRPLGRSAAWQDLIYLQQIMGLLNARVHQFFAVRSVQNGQQTAFLFLQWPSEARHGYDGDL